MAKKVGYYKHTSLWVCPFSNGVVYGHTGNRKEQTSGALCGTGIRRLFYLPDNAERFEMVMCTEPPEHDEYYQVSRMDGNWWTINMPDLYMPLGGVDVMMQGKSPWTYGLMMMADRVVREWGFANKKNLQLYVWLEV